ncbi:ERF family protein [Dietzia sp. MNB45]|uniref:ERF family protein n=1 Tax=Dietzia sp. MNB45 TaxID=3238800 RepID=UPI003F7DD29D
MEKETRTDSAPDNKELYAALVKFQGSCPNVEKTKTANAGKYGYSYADLGIIRDTIRKPLEQAGLAVIQHLDGGRDEWTVLTTTLVHTSGQSISSRLDIATKQKTAQELGSLYTYMKRYALGAILGIATEDDDDGQAGNSKPASAPQTAPRASTKKEASEKQLAAIKRMGQQLGHDDEWYATVMMKIDTSADASAVIEKLKEKLAEQEATSE